MSNNLVSVIIPAYNAEKSVTEALDSVFCQTYRPIEIIVVDDGSTDNTAKVVKNYQLQHKRYNPGKKACALKYIYQSNGGPSKARNTGIEKSAGDYIAFLDADDLWTADKLDKQMQLFKREQRIDIIFCNVETTKSKNGRVDSFIMFDRSRLNKNFFGHDYIVLNPLEKLLKINFMLTPAVIAKKTCFRDGIFFNEKRQYAEDWELWLKMSLHFTFGYINDVCVHVRDEGDGLTANSPDMKLSALEIFEDFLKENMAYILMQIPKQQLSACIRDTYKWAGYYFMLRGDNKLARKLYKKSIRESFDIKTMIYYLKSLLPLV